MEIKKVQINNGRYYVDIDISRMEWLNILLDKNIVTEKYKETLLKFYKEPNHKATCKFIGEKYGVSPFSINAYVLNFAKAVQRKLNRFKVIGADGKPTYWIIPMKGKHIEGGLFEWSLRDELVRAIEYLDKMGNYIKFKHLLEYFVSHLEWVVNEDKTFIGHKWYIEPINDFKNSGQGHKGQNIQNQINEWDSYLNGRIFININPTGYKKKGCYLNWEDTAINVNAIWDNDNTIKKLKIVKDSYPISSAIDVMSYSVNDLGLFDGNPPNENLIEFFDKFNELKMEWNKAQENAQSMRDLQQYIDLLEESKNLIFTGAPGTGKTYLAKEITKQMIGIQNDEKLTKSEQFCFVQFHPSYDYTDFVEGLRPTHPNENGNIGFELKDGVFKDFCKKAIKNLKDSSKSVDELRNEVTLTENLLNFIDYVNQKINEEGEFGLVGIGGRPCAPIVEINEKIFRTKAESQNILSTSLTNILSLYEKYKQNESIQWTFREVTNKLGVTYHHTYFFAFIKAFDKFINQNSVNVENVEMVERKNYVFLIDEINRGEISKIFGELFFSIDPSYRGEKGAVKTQYSNLHDDENEMFYIPENVYIIGTMNDIDRSVESSDFAMRRRFAWQEITAEESANNMNLSDEVKFKMNALNKAIENIEGLNSSYHIGGAYFLNLSKKDENSGEYDFDKLWKLRIEPLLKEYLRGMPDSEESLKSLQSAFNSAYQIENNGQ